MAEEKNQKIKLLKIMEILRQETDEEHPMTKVELAARLVAMNVSCSPRSLIRDIKLLNEQGYEIMERLIGHEKGYFVCDRSFSVPELKILIDAVQAASFVTEKKTAELVDTIAQEEKIVPYLDIPIQHCNDDILKAMNRRDTKESIRKVFHDLRARIPGLVLRTSIIAGLPGEGEKEFEELCDFLREEKIERAGVFPFSPEEGTKAATMEHVPMEEAQRRTELLVDVQSDIIDEYNESVLGDVREVLCEGWSEEAQSFVGRSYAESPDIDGRIWFDADREVEPGTFVTVRLTGVMDGELTGELAEE